MVVLNHLLSTAHKIISCHVPWAYIMHHLINRYKSADQFGWSVLGFADILFQRVRNWVGFIIFSMLAKFINWKVRNQDNEILVIFLNYQMIWKVMTITRLGVEDVSRNMWRCTFLLLNSACRNLPGAGNITLLLSKINWGLEDLRKRITGAAV